MKDTLTDSGLKVDDKVVDELVKNPDEMAGVQKILGDEQKNESGAVQLSDIDWDGPAILKYDNPNEPEWGGFYVNDSEWSSDVHKASEFDSKEDAQRKIDELVKTGDFDGDYLYIWSAKSKFDEEESSGDEDKVYLRIDDDDLELHGYVGRGDKDLNIVQDEKDAVEYTRGDAETEITNLCEKHHYDPETFSLQDIGTQVPSDGENWISLDPMNPSATTTAQ